MCTRMPSKALFNAGLVAFLVSSLLQVVARHYPQVHPDLMDGLRGAGLGVFFGATALTVWRKGRWAA